MFLVMRFLVTVFFVLLGINLTIAQQGVLTGKVIDKKTGEDLIGATVSIEGTTTGAIVDLNGNYNLKTNPGTYNVICSFIS
jgi:hypothetical protein